MRTAKLTFLCAGALCSSSLLAAPSSSPLSAPIIGRVPIATAPVITNVTVPGKNPAQGDVLKATYTYADPDNDLADPTRSEFSWSAAGAAISGATAETFTPTAAQNKKFLKFAVTPASLPPADPFKATAPVTSPDSLAPVLPPRAQLASEYTEVSSSKSWGDAYMHCAGLNSRLPSVTELQTLFTTYTRANTAGEDSENDINKTYGWGNVHWSSSATVDRGTYVYLGENGRSSSNVITNSYRFACAKFGAPEGVPSVTVASVPAATVGTPVTAVYTYNGNATIPDRSRFKWYTATATNGSGKVLATGAGATTKTYTPVAADAGKYLMVEITPASYDTVVGTMVSAVSAQIVSSLTITGLAIEKPTAERASFQANHTVIGGTEADLTYQWYWKGNAVDGATEKTFAFSSLTIPSASAAEELKVEVSKRPAVANRLNRVAEEKAALATATLGLKSSIAWNPPFDQGTWYDMAKTCARQSNGNKRPGTTAELQALHASLGNMAAYVVNTSNSYWTGTIGATQGTHQIVHLGKGEMSNNYPDDWASERGLCVAGTAPALVSNVSISGYDQWGTPQIDGTLKGEYTYEANGGSADASTYRWLGGATASTSRTYKLTKADRGKTLTFEVTAKNASGTVGNTQGVAASKRVSIFKQFVKPDKEKYPRIDPPLGSGTDIAEMECLANGDGSRLPTANELTTLFRDEVSGGSNTSMCSKHDWPVNGQCSNPGYGTESRYWTDDKTSAGKEAYHVNLSNGAVSQTYIGNAFYVACIKR
ncbi:hypothetical protein ACIQVE_01940 [Pseudomonas sp. NPDC098747]|uniref:hypothetical protein n=1 Tax=Pseudomonas sp. NPDC098747 TaxID=3364487 RepID=UPI00383B6026